MSGEILVFIEHDRGALSESTIQSIGFAHHLASAIGATSIGAVTVGAEADGLSAELQGRGLATIHQLHHTQLVDYDPEAWGEALAAVAASVQPVALVGLSTDRGNEVLAHASAVLDVPFAANVSAVHGGSPVGITRVRWGGSLLEEATIEGAPIVLSGAMYVFGETGEQASGGDAAVVVHDVALAETAGRARVMDRVTLEAGITLQTAPVVVSGGRGMGSPDGFAILDELAGLVGGAVGCSRVVTNNGWRPHSDQVGQTGKRVAPELYIACAISGATQHWVGMMASKRVLAINTDPGAPMVTKSTYSVIGDVHQVLNAVVAEIKARKG